MANLEVLFAPAEFASLAGRDLSRTTCVVFDILRATSTIVTALANGAEAIIPVAEIPEALAWRARRPEILLAGERDGLRIPARLAQGVEFDLGNSPREFSADKINARVIALSTTNGSRALRASAPAQCVLAGSFLNLRATADYCRQRPGNDLLLVCSGTGEQAAYEDSLAAGALADLLWPEFGAVATDSANIARQLYCHHQHDLMTAMEHSRNARRLLSNPDLRDDVAWCLRCDCFPLVAKMQDGMIQQAN